MEKVSQYTVITLKLKRKSLFSKTIINEENFSKLVNKKIQEGWQPIGGVSVANMYSDGMTYGMKMSQAMVKYK